MYIIFMLMIKLTTTYPDVKLTFNQWAKYIKAQINLITKKNERKNYIKTS